MKLSCPFCGQHIEIEEAGRYQCPACNKIFEVEREETTQVPAQVPGLATCPYCKGAVNPYARKCTHCGEWIKEKPKSKAVYFLLWMLLPIGMLGFAEEYIGRRKTAIFIAVLNLILLFLWGVSHNPESSISGLFHIYFPCVIGVNFCAFISGFRHIESLSNR